MIALAIAVMIGDGCCAFVSLSLGKKESESANRSVGNAVVLTALCGIILAAIYLIFQEPIISMFGGTVNVETFRHSKEYFFYISLGIPFVSSTTTFAFHKYSARVMKQDGPGLFSMIKSMPKIGKSIKRLPDRIQM